MQPLLSRADRSLLMANQVKIEIDSAKRYGVIICQNQNRHFKVNLLNYKILNDSTSPDIGFKEEILRQSAGKVAVMLLMKNLLPAEQKNQTTATSQNGLLKYQINQIGFTRLPDNLTTTHEDEQVSPSLMVMDNKNIKERNTREHYDALMNYLSNPEKMEDLDDSQNFSDNIEEEDPENEYLGKDVEDYENIEDIENYDDDSHNSVGEFSSSPRIERVFAQEQKEELGRKAHQKLTPRSLLQKATLSEENLLSSSLGIQKGATPYARINQSKVVHTISQTPLGFSIQNSQSHLSVANQPLHSSMQSKFKNDLIDSTFNCISHVPRYVQEPLKEFDNSQDEYDPNHDDSSGIEYNDSQQKDGLSDQDVLDDENQIEVEDFFPYQEDVFFNENSEDPNPVENSTIEDESQQNGEFSDQEVLEDPAYDGNNSHNNDEEVGGSSPENQENVENSVVANHFDPEIEKEDQVVQENDEFCDQGGLEDSVNGGDDSVNSDDEVGGSSVENQENEENSTVANHLDSFNIEEDSVSPQNVEFRNQDVEIENDSVLQQNDEFRNQDVEEDNVDSNDSLEALFLEPSEGQINEEEIEIHQELIPTIAIQGAKSEESSLEEVKATPSFSKIYQNIHNISQVFLDFSRGSYVKYFIPGQSLLAQIRIKNNIKATNEGTEHNINLAQEADAQRHFIMIKTMDNAQALDEFQDNAAMTYLSQSEQIGNPDPDSNNSLNQIDDSTIKYDDPQQNDETLRKLVEDNSVIDDSLENLFLNASEKQTKEENSPTHQELISKNTVQEINSEKSSLPLSFVIKKVDKENSQSAVHSQFKNLNEIFHTMSKALFDLTKQGSIIECVLPKKSSRAPIQIKIKSLNEPELNINLVLDEEIQPHFIEFVIAKMGKATLLDQSKDKAAITYLPQSEKISVVDSDVSLMLISSSAIEYGPLHNVKQEYTSVNLLPELKPQESNSSFSLIKKKEKKAIMSSFPFADLYKNIRSISKAFFNFSNEGSYVRNLISKQSVLSPLHSHRYIHLALQEPMDAKKLQHRAFEISRPLPLDQSQVLETGNDEQIEETIEEEVNLEVLDHNVDEQFQFSESSPLEISDLSKNEATAPEYVYLVQENLQLQQTQSQLKEQKSLLERKYHLLLSELNEKQNQWQSEKDLILDENQKLAAEIARLKVKINSLPSQIVPQDQTETTTKLASYLKRAQQLEEELEKAKEVNFELIDDSLRHKEVRQGLENQINDCKRQLDEKEREVQELKNQNKELLSKFEKNKYSSQDLTYLKDIFQKEFVNYADQNLVINSLQKNVEDLQAALSILLIKHVHSEVVTDIQMEGFLSLLPKKSTDENESSVV